VLLATTESCRFGPAEPADATPPAGTVPVELEVVTSGLDFPLYLTTPPGDARLFVLEKGGRIRIVKNGALLPAPFLDLSAKVSTGSEQGLLGLAFDPAYASHGRFIVHYTNPDGDTRLSRFTASADPDIADPSSEQVILAVDQPFSNHNGGQILFGPDGYLYLGLGDGGGTGDPDGRGQAVTDLFGSILRLDLSAGSGEPYAVPADNPFAASGADRGEVWSYGLRNPWRFSFDRGTGDLYIADVGQSAREEINVAPAAEGSTAAGRGLNFGWSRMEGSRCFRSGSCDRTGLMLPVKEYGHGSGCSITGGYVYRGAAIPELLGHYFYADFCSGWMRSFRLRDGAAVDEAEWPTLRPGGSITSFGEDAVGELYVLEAGGTVYRIVKLEDS
jgi:glucose/arabinose dehydrogenase